MNHEAYAKRNPPAPGYSCGKHSETFGGGCFNCGWHTERDAIYTQARADRVHNGWSAPDARDLPDYRPQS